MDFALKFLPYTKDHHIKDLPFINFTAVNQLVNAYLNLDRDCLRIKNNPNSSQTNIVIVINILSLYSLKPPSSFPTSAYF